MEQPVVHVLPPPVQLSNAIRKFWVNINRLTRVYLARTLFHIGGQEARNAINESLSRAVDDLETILAEYYGEDISLEIRSDFLNYIHHLELLIDAYANNDESAIIEHRNHLYGLAGSYAQSYAIINNYLNRSVIQGLFYSLINSVERQIISIQNEDYMQDLEEYEMFMDVGYRLADEFTYGILRQFFPGSDQ